MSHPQAQHFDMPAALEARIDELIGRYPFKRSAGLMVLHAIQEHYGFVSKEAMVWAAGKLGVQPVQVLELVTFYPMFRQAPAGRFHFKICRTLSCALNGSHQIHEHLCGKLGLDAAAHGPQTTADGRFTVEFVECLANCHTAPVLTCNDQQHESVTLEKAGEILARCAS